MLELSVSVETANGLTWPSWKRLVAIAEQLGFAGLFRSDHLANPDPPDAQTLDMIVALTYLADHTERLHFGPLVAPLSFRDPVILAHQAAALDALSQGRMILGLGAGWAEREHAMFGYALGDVPTRAARFDEGVALIARLLRGDEPVTYQGQHYQLSNARLLTHAWQPQRPPILIGGNGPKRTLPLVARYADIWNALYMPPDEFASRSAQLDTLLAAENRAPDAVKRTILLWPVLGRDEHELEQRVAWLRNDPNLAGLGLDDLLAKAKEWGGFVGTPAEFTERLREYAAVGVKEVMLQLFDAGDIDGLRLFAEAIMPNI